MQLRAGHPGCLPDGSNSRLSEMLFPDGFVAYGQREVISKSLQRVTHRNISVASSFDVMRHSGARSHVFSEAINGGLK